MAAYLNIPDKLRSFGPEYKAGLISGQRNLLTFKSSNESGPTGLEEPLLAEPYFTQMLNLNKYIYTSASTNYVDNPYFQEMFITFACH